MNGLGKQTPFAPVPLEQSLWVLLSIAAWVSHWWDEHHLNSSLNCYSFTKPTEKKFLKFRCSLERWEIWFCLQSMVIHHHDSRTNLFDFWFQIFDREQVKKEETFIILGDAKLLAAIQPAQKLINLAKCQKSECNERSALSFDFGYPKKWMIESFDFGWKAVVRRMVEVVGIGYVNGLPGTWQQEPRGQQGCQCATKRLIEIKTLSECVDVEYTRLDNRIIVVVGRAQWSPRVDRVTVIRVSLSTPACDSCATRRDQTSSSKQCPVRTGQTHTPLRTDWPLSRWQSIELARPGPSRRAWSQSTWTLTRLSRPSWRQSLIIVFNYSPVLTGPRDNLSFLSVWIENGFHVTSGMRVVSMTARRGSSWPEWSNMHSIDKQSCECIHQSVSFQRLVLVFTNCKALNGQTFTWLNGYSEKSFSKVKCYLDPKQSVQFALGQCTEWIDPNRFNGQA